MLKHILTVTIIGFAASTAFAAADPSYAYNIRYFRPEVGGPPGPLNGFYRSVNDSESTGVQIEDVSDNPEDRQSLASAKSLPGAIGSSISASSTGGELRVTNQSTMTVHDLMISGSAQTAVTSINLDFDGSLGAGGRRTTVENSDSHAGISVAIRVLNGTEVLLEQSGNADASFGNTSYGDPDGLLAGFSNGNFNLTTDSFTVPTGTPLTLTMILTAIVSVYSPAPDFSASASSQFFNTLSLNTDGDVFNNPDNDSAFNVASEDSNLSGNSYTAVPEPATVGLLSIGAMSLLLRRRRRCAN